MKPRIRSKIILFSLVGILVVLLTACGTPSEPSTSPDTSTANKEPVIEVIKTGVQYDTVTHTEDVERDFCDSPTGTTINKETSIQSSESISISISGDLRGSVPGIEVKVGSAIQNAYGQTKGIRTSEKLEFPPGSHYKYTVEYFETWVEGSVLVTIGQEEPYSIPFEYRVAYGLNTTLVDMRCPPPAADFSVLGDTIGTAPFTVQFVDQSQGTITNWSWNFGNGIGTSNMQSPIYTYDEPSYTFNGSRVCFETGAYSVSLTVSNDQGADSQLQDGLITVLPREYTVRVQPEPIALKDGNGFKLLHLPGCSQTCDGGISLSGEVLAGACLTSVTSEQYDETGYYLDGQTMAFQASHRITYCPTGYSAIQTGIWEFDKWSDPDINNADTQISQPEGDHNPIFTVDKDLYVRAHYKWIAACP